MRRLVTCLSIVIALGLAAPMACGGSSGSGDAGQDLPDATGDTWPSDVPVDPIDIPGDEGRDHGLDADRDAADATETPDAYDSETDAGPLREDWRLPALTACSPMIQACEVEPATAGAAASFRKDFFFPYEQYPEDNIPDPMHGGRVQIVATAGLGGAITMVEIAGHDVTAMALPVDRTGGTPQEVLALTGPRTFDWVHVWPLTLGAGEPFFVTFHSGATWLDEAASLAVRIETAQGTAFQGAAIPMHAATVPLTYVTTAKDNRSLMIHLRNEGTEPRVLDRLVVNGLDVTLAACIPGATIQPGETALWTVPLCRPLRTSDPWTVVAEWVDAPPSVGAGRVIMPHYPIHAWVNEADCPFPGANWQNFVAHREKGFDMPFLRGAFAKPGCNDATAREIVSKSSHIQDQYYLLDEWADVDGLDTTRIARLLGDEVDSGYGDKPWKVSQDAKANWLRHPRMTTYIGGARHRYTATFSGIADIQGFDIYFASCAPSILVGEVPPLRAPYDYCRSVRANHMPGPNWFYSQGLHGWGGDLKREPDAMELKVSAMSVAACGSKGLMYFRTDMAGAGRQPETWEAMGEVNRVVRSVREFLREGDSTDAARADVQDVVVQAIRAREAIVVPVVNVHADEVVDHVRCIFEEHPYWTLADVRTDITIPVPGDFQVVELLEVVDGAVFPVAEDAYAIGREVTIPGVALSQDRPYRVFVLAGVTGLADRILADMGIPQTGPEPADLPVAAETACAPSLDRCAVAPVDPGLTASLRKDFFFPYEMYPEAKIPDPLNGGRVQVTAIAGASGRITKVRIHGTDVSAMIQDWGAGENVPDEIKAFTDDAFLHWVHVWPRVAVAGEPVWVAFHSGQAWLDTNAAIDIRVETDTDEVLSGSFVPSTPAVPVAYVTTSDTFDTFLVHMRNMDDSPHTLSRLILDGFDVTDAACIPSRTVAPGETVLWTVPLCQATARGRAWTLVAEWDDAVPSAAGGRVVSTHFPINTWPSSSDCPFPGANEETWHRHRAAGIDTPFLWRQTYAQYDGCNGADAQTILGAAESIPDQFLLVERGISLDGWSTERLTSFVGDEPDAELGDAPWNKARHSILLWDRNPEVATYVGGSRHRRTGAFAGVTDIQGFDIYVSACAPYIMDFGNFPPLRSPFDYSRAVRFNHMPGPTWFYSHGMLGKKDPVREPSPSELWLQALSPIAAGAKGLMYFQTNMGGADRRPDSWQAISDANHVIRGVRRFLQEGDPTGQAVADHPDVLVDAIRARDAMIVPVLNAAAEVWMDDLRCIFEQDPHWVLGDVLTTVRVTVPDDFAVSRVFEVLPDGVVVPGPIPYRFGRDVVLPLVALSEQVPARVFVLADDPAVADRIRADLAPMP